MTRTSITGKQFDLLKAGTEEKGAFTVAGTEENAA